MWETLRIFRLLLFKNLLVRKSQWKLSLFGEFIVPVGLVMCIWLLRNNATNPPVEVKTDTFHQIMSKESLMNQSFGFSYGFRINIYYSPNNDFANTFMMEQVKNCLGENGSITFKRYATEEELIRNYKKNEYSSFLPTIAVVFDDKFNEATKQLEYKIRTKYLQINDLFNAFLRNITSYYTLMNGITPIQICVDESFTRIKTKDTPTYPQVFIQEFPYPPHLKLNTTDEMFRQFFSMLIVIAFMIPLFIETSNASNEKFLGINVLMSMNGVSNALNLTSWLVSGLIFISICCVLPILIMLITPTNDVIPYVYYGNPFIIWLVFTLHLTHLFSYGIHVSAYFSRSLFVVFALLVLGIVAMVIQMHALNEKTYAIAPYLGIFLPNFLIVRAIEEINYYESISEGVQWSNLLSVGNTSYKVGGSIGMIIIFSIIGFIFHFTMAVYVYAINPGKYGIRKHPLFFLKNKSKTYTGDSVENLNYNGLSGKPFETVSEGIFVPGIQIRNLKKTYNIGLVNKSKVFALRGVSIDFYKGQITSLLGHNGAGKTTMMSIMTGMLNPTDGLVLINSKNLKDHSSEIMNDMGLCTQENLVFPNLTVNDQITFFAMLKGRGKTKSVIKQNVKIFLEKLKLYEKRNCLPKDLSGGQKRRVCLGMALVGDPSILVLDEPTSGLDPESRRVIWDILLKLRGDKTILISTHDMEEADILGDRIAIMHTGQLKSYGTSMFLKKLIGQGNVEVTLAVEPSSDFERIKSELDCEGKIVTEDGSKIVLSIPYSSDLSDWLDKVETNKNELGISGLSVSLISLEQVFLKVTRENDDPTISSKLFNKINEKSSGTALFLQLVGALIYKKATYTVKNISTIIFMLALVIIALVCISISLKETSVAKSKEKLIPIDLDLYNQPETYYKSYDESFGQQYKLVTEHFGGKANSIEQNSRINDALMDLAKENINIYDKHIIAAVEFNQTNTKDSTATAFYSSKATFSLPISMNLLSNAIIKEQLGDDYSISTSIQQLPVLNYQDMTLINTFSTTVTFTFVFYSIVALFVLHPVREFSTGVKQLQRMTGVSCFSYWGTIFVFDLIIYALIVIVIVIGFYCMDTILDLKIYRMNDILLSILLLMLFAFSILPLIYIFSFTQLKSTAAVRLLSYIPIGLVTLEIIMIAVKMSLSDNDIVKIIRPIQKRIFLLIPYLSFFHGQFVLFETAQTNARCRRMPNVFYETVCATGYANDKCCYLECYDGECKKYVKYFTNFDDDMTLEESLVYLCITPILYFGILTVLEYQLIPKLIAKMKKLDVPDYPGDEQVRKEKFSIAQKISALNDDIEGITNNNFDNGQMRNSTSSIQDYPSNNNLNNQIFFVYELRKQYGKLMAVDDVSFGVNQHECFGLLGVNGAGKSTAFRMMTGGEVPDNGIMYIGDKSFKDHKNYFLSQMGYCPQNDAIIKSLNAYDHLRLFARLRGIPRDQVESEVQTWILRLNLTACASQPSGTYSGGNKRRLNIAIALIGIPNLVLMDEPTTGVDPGARRSLWNVIQSCQTIGQAVVLTSHSMEECEALCNRLAIMVDGRFVCIGPSEELKHRFGAGYDIQIKMNLEKAVYQVDEIKRSIVQALNCELIDENAGYLMYHVKPEETTWRKMDDAMNALKERFDCVDDYSVLSSTLEQLFLLFARTTKKNPNRKTD